MIFCFGNFLSCELLQHLQIVLVDSATTHVTVYFSSVCSRTTLKKKREKKRTEDKIKAIIYLSPKHIFKTSIIVIRQNSSSYSHFSFSSLR